MIEKLKTINPYDETEIDMDTNSVAGLVYENTPLVQKINELVDAVNAMQNLWLEVATVKKIMLELQTKVEILEEQAHPTATTEPADPYAEQRKWIGKLCKFRDNDEDKWNFGVLKEIYERSDFPFGDFDNFEWAICEPVKPDDDIIYKGV